LQTPLLQSVCALQVLPAAHLLQAVPPQSVSPSVPFLIESLQDEGPGVLSEVASSAASTDPSSVEGFAPASVDAASSRMVSEASPPLSAPTKGVGDSVGVPELSDDEHFARQSVSSIRMSKPTSRFIALARPFLLVPSDKRGVSRATYNRSSAD
jgi:hypothetical protein